MFKTTHLANMLIPTSHFTPLYTCDMWREPEKMLRQPCDVTDAKRFASVSILIYFILAQFKGNRIRDCHTICIGYLIIDPLNFPERLDLMRAVF